MSSAAVRDVAVLRTTSRARQWGPHGGVSVFALTKSACRPCDVQLALGDCECYLDFVYGAFEKPIDEATAARLLREKLRRGENPDGESEAGPSAVSAQAPPESHAGGLAGPEPVPFRPISGSPTIVVGGNGTSVATSSAATPRVASTQAPTRIQSRTVSAADFTGLLDDDSTATPSVAAADADDNSMPAAAAGFHFSKEGDPLPGQVEPATATVATLIMASFDDHGCTKLYLHLPAAPLRAVAAAAAEGPVVEPRAVAELQRAVSVAAEAVKADLEAAWYGPLVTFGLMEP